MSSLIKSICDPSQIEILTLPERKAEVIQTVSHHHFCAIDPTAYWPKGTINILLQAITGLSYVKRAQYTNDDDYIYNFSNCIVLKGCDSLKLSSNIISKTISITVDELNPHNRIPESTLMAKFEEHKAEILGGIFNVISIAIRNYTKIQLTYVPRLADFTIWGCAIMTGLEHNQEDFKSAYLENINNNGNKLSSNNSLVSAIYELNPLR